MAWLTTLTKLAPYVVQLSEVGVSALPHITRRKTPPVVAPIETRAAEDDKVTQKQIAELQAAATQNAEHIKEIATSLTSAITTVEARLRRLELITYTAIAIALAALVGAAVAFTTR